MSPNLQIKRPFQTCLRAEMDNLDESAEHQYQYPARLKLSLQTRLRAEMDNAEHQYQYPARLKLLLQTCLRAKIDKLPVCTVSCFDESAEHQYQYSALSPLSSNKYGPKIRIVVPAHHTVHLAYVKAWVKSLWDYEHSRMPCNIIDTVGDNGFSSASNRDKIGEVYRIPCNSIDTVGDTGFSSASDRDKVGEVYRGARHSKLTLVTLVSVVPATGTMWERFHVARDTAGWQYSCDIYERLHVTVLIQLVTLVSVVPATGTRWERFNVARDTAGWQYACDIYEGFHVILFIQLVTLVSVVPATLTMWERFNVARDTAGWHIDTVGDTGSSSASDRDKVGEVYCGVR
ncbi:hypothetical protein J6590_070854 [Homalodisca vitripennis]|nr:hypothetical protein J6590_070854 [Homalodisca vitripennis]